MKKTLCYALAMVLLLCLGACGQDSSTPVPDVPADVENLSDSALADVVAVALGVPKHGGISYTITGPYYWDAAERDVKNIEFCEYGQLVACASVDSATGELLRNIGRYNMSKSVASVVALEQALKGKSLILVKNNTIEQKKLTEFTYGVKNDYTFVPSKYTYIDMDADGTKEILVQDTALQFWAVLRYDYDAKQVRGYLLPYRSIIDPRADGTVKGSEGAAVSSINRMTFHGPDYTWTALAERNDTKQMYRLDGADADREVVERFFTEWNYRTRPLWGEYK